MNPREVEVIGTRRYQIRSTGNSSARFGPCEICDRHVSDVFIQVVTVRYEDPDLGESWTYHEAPPTLFGHEGCLRDARKERS